MDQKQLRFYFQTGNLKQIRECIGELSPEQMAECLRGVFQMPLRPEVLEYLGAEMIRLPAEIGAPLLVDLLYSEEAAARNLGVELFSAYGLDAMAVLHNHLNDLDVDVRLFAVQALSLIPSRHEVLRLLRAQCLVERDLNVLATVIEALGDLGTFAEDADAIRTVMGQLSHPYLEFVANRALERLGSHAGPSAQIL